MRIGIVMMDVRSAEGGRGVLLFLDGRRMAGGLFVSPHFEGRYLVVGRFG